MEISPSFTGPDEQGAYGIQNGTETFYMYPRGGGIVFEQWGFTPPKNPRAAIAKVATELKVIPSPDNICCYIELGLGASIRLNAYISSVEIVFCPSPGSKGIPPLALRKLTEIKVLLASLVSE